MEHMNQASRHIVGSAEPLNKNGTDLRLKELEAWGVDLSLIRASLKRTPEERITRMVGLLKFINELQSGYSRTRDNATRRME